MHVAVLAVLLTEEATRSKVALRKVQSAMRWADKLHSRVLRLLKELGATPQALAKLGHPLHVS